MGSSCTPRTIDTLRIQHVALGRGCVVKIQCDLQIRLCVCMALGVHGFPATPTCVRVTWIGDMPDMCAASQRSAAGHWQSEQGQCFNTTMRAGCGVHSPRPCTSSTHTPVGGCRPVRGEGLKQLVQCQRRHSKVAYLIRAPSLLCGYSKHPRLRAQW